MIQIIQTIRMKIKAATTIIIPMIYFICILMCTTTLQKIMLKFNSCMDEKTNCIWSKVN
jgi:hypothetical protein